MSHHQYIMSVKASSLSNIVDLFLLIIDFHSIMKLCNMFEFTNMYMEELNL